MVIHWDWFWTIALLVLVSSFTGAIVDAVKKPLETERLRAEAAMFSAKEAYERSKR